MQKRCGEPQFCQPILPQLSELYIQHLDVVSCRVLLSHIQHIIFLAINLIKTTISLYKTPHSVMITRFLFIPSSFVKYRIIYRKLC